MREILFRGKIKGTQTGHYELDWAMGDKVTELSTGRVFICDLSHFDNKTLLNDVLIEVIPETVGQFTGLTDKNGTKIFENDIVCCWGGEYCQGYWEHDSNITVLDAYSIVEMSESENIEIIKDIHDNPNLLGGDGS